MSGREEEKGGQGVVLHHPEATLLCIYMASVPKCCTIWISDQRVIGMLPIFAHKAWQEMSGSDQTLIDSQEVGQIHCLSSEEIK